MKYKVMQLKNYDGSPCKSILYNGTTFNSINEAYRYKGQLEDDWKYDKRAQWHFEVWEDV